MTTATYTINHAIDLFDADHFDQNPPPKMKPEVKEKWLAHLRSGEFIQATGNLKKVPADSVPDEMSWEEPLPEGVQCAYCCLGVLCEVAVQDSIIDAASQATGSEWGDTDPGDKVYYYDYFRYANHEDLPAQEVYDYAGVNDAVGSWLASQNDQGRTFGQIANWIEKYL